MVAQDVVDLAIGIHREQPPQPSDALFDGLFVRFQGAPSEVEDIASKDERVGLSDGRLESSLDLRSRAASGEQVKIGNEMGSRKLHRFILTSRIGCQQAES